MMVSTRTRPDPVEVRRAARAWYDAHRADVLARLADSERLATRDRRSAELLVLALDDDPAVVARARTVH